MDKQFVVLRYPPLGRSRMPRYCIMADYGDYAWGSALYEVVGYYPTRYRANEAMRADRHEQLEAA
jgi:hypothetical protein